VRLTFVFSRHRFRFLILLLILAGSLPRCEAQAALTLREAITKALDSRAGLRAEAERVSAARGLESQSRLIANPTFQFENQNLRPGQNYSADVDTYAYLTQPLDILGKRKQRIAVASLGVASRQADYDLVRRQIVDDVKHAYWDARAAQEVRKVLKATMENFQRIIDYHAAQFSTGAIAEQDLLRIRLEGERLQIDANLAAIQATKARVQLQKEMGQPDFPDLLLTEPLDSTEPPLSSLDIQQVLERHVEMRVAKAALDEARAKAKFEDASARPDLSISYGYKRTELVDTNTGTNTALAGFQITLPFTDRNQGNRMAASAEVRRREQLLAQAESEVKADYFSALQEYNLRRREVAENLQPLREHSIAIADIAQQAYQQGGTDLLRLLDAERVRLDAQLAWVQGMMQYQQSVVDLQTAEGVSQ
jgi:outer membrane protein, heavy metal efflux system